jgi:hypothetical protein
MGELSPYTSLFSSLLGFNFQQQLGKATVAFVDVAGFFRQRDVEADVGAQIIFGRAGFGGGRQRVFLVLVGFVGGRNYEAKIK